MPEQVIESFVDAKLTRISRSDADVVEQTQRTAKLRFVSTRPLRDMVGSGAKCSWDAG